MRADAAMERPIIGKYRNYFWCVIFATLLLWFLLLYFYDTTIMVRKNPVTWFGDNSIDSNSQDSRSIFIDKNPNENVQKTGDFAESVQKTGFFAESGQKTGDFAESVQKTGDFVENVQTTGDFAEPIYARTKFGNKPIDVFGVAVDDPNSVSDKESETNNQIDEETDNEESPFDSVPVVEKKTESEIRQQRKQNKEEVNCTGKYIYVHHLPRQFNEDLIRDCRSLSDWINMCPYTSGFGLGPRFEKPDKIFSRTGWYTTNQFMLEIIFYSRMKQYKCLTTNSTLSSAIFVPYYAGLDVARYLWGSRISVRDSASLDLVKWLRQKPEWKRMSGRDHFLVAGRITWDFRRLTNEESAWGNKLMLLPESRNMTMLTIESSPWNNNDIAIPYPTYFHPSSDIEVFQWQNRMRRQRRRVLFSFVGATRPNIIDSIRAEIIEQCIAAGRKCKLLDCNSRGNKCYKPVFVMKTFQNSVFCLQPAGDSYTRRSTFDSILAGCIPVFFHPGSAYVQYLWHLPKDYRQYSVYIPANDIKDGKVSIERILHKIPKGKVMAMREEVLKLIPRVIYADPRSRLETLEDAFDITVKGVLERIERIRREMERGKNSGSDHPEVFSWKYNLFGNVKELEWDSLFEKT